MTREQRAHVARRFKAIGNRIYRNEIVQSGLRWGLKLAHRYARAYGSYYLFLDLLQEANIGLIMAAERFNPDSGYSFSTYATWWVRHRITRFLIDQARAVRVPVYRHEQLQRLKRTAEWLEKKLERQPTRREIELGSGLDEKTLRSIRKTPFYGVVSLDEPVCAGNDADGSMRKDLIASTEQIAAYFRAIHDEKFLESISQFILANFKKRSAQMVIQYFGLNGDGPKTLEEIAQRSISDRHGKALTRERVRQIIEKVISSPRLKWFVTGRLVVAERRAEILLRAQKNKRVQAHQSSCARHIFISIERTEISDNGHSPRDVVRCGECGLVQYLPKNMHCRKCSIEFLLVDQVEVRIPAAITGSNKLEQPQEILTNTALVENIGQRIRTLREARGMTRDKLQKLSRVSRSHLSCIESGQKTPSLGTLEKIGEALGVGLTTFFTPKQEVDRLALLSDPFINSLREHLPNLQLHQLSELLDRLRMIQPLPTS